MTGYYVHLPLHISRRGVVDVGLRCVHSCQTCFYVKQNEEDPFEFMRKAPWRQTEQLTRQIELMAENGFTAIDITGGEPSTHPDIVDIVQKATSVGIASRIISLGQFFDKRNLLERLIRAGLTDMRFSHHSHDPELFKKITGGDLEKQLWGMNYLDENGFQYTTNTTVSRLNYYTLPDLAREIASHKGVYYANFIMMMSHYEWADSADKDGGLRVEYAIAAPFVKQAVDILEAQGIAVAIRYAPMCSMSGVEKNVVGQVGVYYDPHEWANCVEHSGEGNAEREAQWLPMKPGEASPGAWLATDDATKKVVGRGSSQGLSKGFADNCHKCSAIQVCDGIDFGYLRENGGDEFVPYIHDDRGVGAVLDRDRVHYFAGRVVKTKPFADVKSVTARLLKPVPINDNPKVSIAISNYNYGEYIEKAIQSVLNQTYQNIELFIVDDASTDDSWKIITAYKDNPKVVIHRHKENSGNSVLGHNESFRACEGDLFMYLDSDDWIEPSYVEECVRTFKKNPWASIVYPGLSTFGMEDQEWATVPFDPMREIVGNFIPYCAMFKREVWEENGGYASNVRAAEDWDFWVKAISRGHLAVALPRQLMHYNRKEGGLFETDSKPNHEKKFKQIILNNSEIYPAEYVKWAKT